MIFVYSTLRKLFVLSIGPALSLLTLFVLFWFNWASQPMTINSMRVVDGNVIVLNRTIHEDFVAHWFAEAYSKESLLICSGNGESAYSTQEPRNQSFTIQQFISKDCPEKLPKGAFITVGWYPLNQDLEAISTALQVK